MNHCATCKHWDRSDQYETGHALGLGRCKNVPHYWDSTCWSEDGDKPVLADSHKDKKAFAQDASDYSAYLLTMTDFGCVSHEPKEKP